jgi:hypothetical protein
MAFVPRVIEKFLDLINLQRHNDNYVDIKTELDLSALHIANTTNPHGSTSAATAGAIMQRDQAGRAKVAAPAAADDIARKDTVDTVQGNLSTHASSGDHDVRYYSKTNVQTSGQALVHWDNLTNKPNFSDARWKAPVADKAILDTLLSGNADGDVRLVLADEIVYEWDVEIAGANKWSPIGAIGNGLTSHSALTNLLNDDHPQYHNDDRGDIRYYLKAAVDAFLADKISQAGTLTADLDFSQHQALNFVVHKSAIAPLNPIEGMLWYDTLNLALKIYKGSVAGWVDISGRGAVIRDQLFTALAAQTVFDITVGQYEVGTNAITVYKKNGALFELLPESEYEETNSTRITLVTPAASGEIFYVKFFENSPEVINQAVQRDGTLQVNLNSDLLHGQDGTYYASSSSLTTHLADYTLQIPYGGVTTGAANTYALAAPAITALTEGMAVTVKINVASTGASTLNWNGKGAKGIIKSDGTNVTNLKLNGIYTLRYNGTAFQLQGEGGDYGTAVASDVLTGKTIGTPTGIVAGSMPENGAINITPSSASQAIPAGHTSGGNVAAVVVPVANVLAGTTIAGQAGTMPERGALNYNPSTVAQNIPAGHTSGGTVNPVGGNATAADVANGMGFSSANGIGLVGTGASAKRSASGNIMADGGGILNISGLSFTPRAFFASDNNGTYYAYGTNYMTTRAVYYNGGLNYSSVTFVAGGGTLGTGYGGIAYNWVAIE